MEGEKTTMTTPHNENHILLVEDDVDLRDSISQYLTSSGFLVTEVGSCLECYTVLPTCHFCVAVVDITLPDQSGLVLAEYLRANTELKIIILTAKENLDDRLRGYRAGAHNYFVKPVDCRELIAAIMSLLPGEAPGQDNLSEHAESGNRWHLIRKSWQLITPVGQAIVLSSLELQLLELLALTPGTIVSREILLIGLYQRNDDQSGRALDSLVRRLRAKIVSCGEIPPIKTAHAVGFCFSAPLILS